MKTIDALEALLPNEQACKRMLAELRWPSGVTCPRCGNARVYPVKSRPFHWVCKSGKTTRVDTAGVVTCARNGGYRFSVVTATVFQGTRIPLKLWFKVAYLMLITKQRVSALQIHRVLFGEHSTHDYRTSWAMRMRLSAVMRGDPTIAIGQPVGSGRVPKTASRGIAGMPRAVHADQQEATRVR